MTLNLHAPILAFVCQGFWFQGELAVLWANGRLDWKSIQCRN